MSNLLAIALLFVCWTLHAHDGSVHGHVWEVVEEDLMDVIKHRLDQEGRDWSHSLDISKDPRPVPGLRVARKSSVHYVDPSIQAAQSITDLEGRVIVRKGDRVNPLSIVEMKNAMLFFDGEDERQVEWAKSQPSSSKWVLVHGSPLALEDRENRPVFFDQHGVLCRKLTIREIPSRVIQSGHLIRVESVGLQEGNKDILPESNNNIRDEIIRAIHSLEPDRQVDLQEGNKAITPSIWVAVSFAMPDTVWLALSKEMSNKKDACFVVRGLPGNSWSQLVERITALKDLGVNVPIQIDPKFFRKHNVHSVPCFITDHGKIVGNVSLTYALSQVGL